jgi:hypothetical protein
MSRWIVDLSRHRAGLDFGDCFSHATGEAPRRIARTRFREDARRATRLTGHGLRALVVAGRRDDAVSNSLLIAGIVCMAAAVVAGGAGMAGAKVPVLDTIPRQIMLFVLGLMVVLASYVISATPTPSAAADQASDDSDTCVAQALTCLPRSAAPVVFRNEAAANAAAAQNVKDGLSAADAQAAAEKLGASGAAARLCGDVQAEEVSPLGKHLAAVRLAHLGPHDGRASDACMKMAGAFL